MEPTERHSARLNPAAQRAKQIERLRPLLKIPLIETPDRKVSIVELCIRANESRTTIWRKCRDGRLPQPVAGGFVARDLVATLPWLRGPQGA